MCAATSWMTKLWESASMFNIQIRDPFPRLPLSRVNDQYIIPILAANPHLTDADLQHLNECRMFKKAVTLAHLTTACGRYLEKSATTPQTAHTLQKYTWPRKPTHLPASYWTLWKTTILRLFTHPTSTKGELTPPLEEWIINPTQHWTWWSHESASGAKTVYQKGNLYHHSYTAPHRSRRQTRLRINTPSLSLPPASQITSIKHISASEIEVIGQPRTVTHYPEPSTTPSTWQEHIDKQEEKWLTQHIIAATELPSFVESIRQNNVIAVSDGSGKDRIGSAAAVLHCTHTGQRIKATTMVPGNIQDQSSHRSELVGILLILKLVSMLHTEFDLTGSSITFRLDNDEARIAVMDEYHPSVKKPDYDIIYDIRNRISSLPIKFHSRWIEGHQDKTNTDYDTMDIWTLLNIEMDIDAGLHREAHKQDKTNNIPLPNERTTVWLDNKKLAHFDKHGLYSVVHGRAYTHPTDKQTWSCLQFWQNRKQLTDRALTNIHWHALGKAFRKYPNGKQRWLVKHETGQCGVGRMHLRRKYQDHSRCPRCGQTDK